MILGSHGDEYKFDCLLGCINNDVGGIKQKAVMIVSHLHPLRASVFISVLRDIYVCILPSAIYNAVGDVFPLILDFYTGRKQHTDVLQDKLFG